MGVHFPNTVVKLDQMGYGLQTETVSVFLSSHIIAVFGLAQRAGVIVGNIKIYKAIIHLASDGDLLFTVVDLFAGIHGIFQQVTKQNRQSSFCQRNNLRELHEDIHRDAVLLCLLGKIIQQGVGFVVLTVSNGLSVIIRCWDYSHIRHGHR